MQNRISRAQKHIIGGHFCISMQFWRYHSPKLPFLKNENFHGGHFENGVLRSTYNLHSYCVIGYIMFTIPMHDVLCNMCSIILWHSLHICFKNLGRTNSRSYGPYIVYCLWVLWVFIQIYIVFAIFYETFCYFVSRWITYNMHVNAPS